MNPKTQETRLQGAPAIVSASSMDAAIEVEQLTCTIGAELSNVDLGVASRDPGLVAEIRALLLKHRVLFFRDQDITRAEHVAFARHFGELEDHPVAGSDPEHPGLVRIYKSPDSPNDRYENAWHTDATWREKPPFGCVLRCVECPPVGGDTMWANTVEAYARLPEHIKTQIAGLRARHSIEASFGAAMPIEKRLALKAQYPDAEHPVVRKHPETGEEILFVNAFTTHFTNFHTPENVRFGQDANPGASDLLRYLVSQGLHPRVPGPLPLEEELHGHVGQPFHPALRGDGLPAVPPEDGTRRDHRRRHLLRVRQPRASDPHLVDPSAEERA
jgi:taurine dioxygenase